MTHNTTKLNKIFEKIKGFKNYEDTDGKPSVSV